MSKIVQASELEPGDLYRLYRVTYGTENGGMYYRKVTGRRIVRSTETYAVLETADIEGRGLRGEISLRADLSIEKLEEISPASSIDHLSYMMPGEQLNIVYAEGKYWT